jgi:RNA-directed DNA polymerase
VDVEGFEFLGYRFIGDRKYPRAKSENKFKEAIRQHTRRTNAHSMQVICSLIRPIQKGWFEYYKHSYKTVFNALDAWTRRRLRSILKKRDKRRGIATTNEDNRRYPNALFNSYGLFSLAVAHRELCRSLK